MPFNNNKLYNIFSLCARFALLIYILTFSFCNGCSSSFSLSNTQTRASNFLISLNDIRVADGLKPLAINDPLSKAAQTQANKIAASEAIAAVDELSLPRIIETGCFARFALSHKIIARSIDEAFEKMLSDPLSLGKMGHHNITHIGVGIAKSNSKASKGVVLVVDFARIVSTINTESSKTELLDTITNKRNLIGAPSLIINEQLSEMSQFISNKFISDRVSGDSLLSEKNSPVDLTSFSLGKITKSFQVVSTVSDIIIPARISDPNIKYIGIGISQGNHPEQEPGSVVVVIILAQPQTAHAEKRNISNLPPPKAVPTAKKIKAKGSLVKRAWTATLVGDHEKAAKLFEKAFRKFKKIIFIYEAARANERNNDTKTAIKNMKIYAKLAKGEEKEKAQKMIKKLEDGKSIFSSSNNDKMSLEAKRFFIIGQNLFKQAQWNGAIDAFQQAYVYAPHPDILYNMGLTHLKAGRIGASLDLFAEYQRLVPEARNVDEAKQMFALGVELYQIGQFELAAKRFTLAYSYLPLPELVYNLALCHKAMGNKAEALKLLREYLDTISTGSDTSEIENLIDEIKN